MYSIFDGYYYSRPISYQSYYPRYVKPFVLKDHLDKESDSIRNILSKNRQEFDDKEILARGIHWKDWVFGKRVFHHNSRESSHNSHDDVKVEYYAHQWKPTNDLAHEHPTGSHKVYDNFPQFAAEVEKLVSVAPNKLKLTAH
jgi:hypothetical protein